MVFTLLCTVCTSQEKELALLSLLLPLVHLAYQDSPHLHEPPATALGPGLEGVFAQGPGLGKGQMPEYWTPSAHTWGHMSSSSSTVTSVVSDTPHMVVKTPVKYATEIAKGENTNFRCHIV